MNKIKKKMNKIKVKIITKDEKAITLVALIVTIIILLLLAGITIATLGGENGLFTKTNKSKEKETIANAKEKLELVLEEAKVDENINSNYNSNDYLDTLITERIKNASIDEDTVILDGYKFVIDRQKLQIVDEGEDTVDQINESILGKLAKVKETGYSTITINGTTSDNISESKNYSLHTIVYKGNMILDGKNMYENISLNNNVYEIGDNTRDVATASTEASNTVVLFVKGNLIINSGVTLTSCKSEEGYGGPKGLIVYCTGTITNNGNISMTSRGAKAIGDNVYLWKNSDGTFEYVPAVGAMGGSGYTGPFSSGSDYKYYGVAGSNGTNRQTRWRRLWRRI